MRDRMRSISWATASEFFSFSSRASWRWSHSHAPAKHPQTQRFWGATIAQFTETLFELALCSDRPHAVSRKLHTCFWQSWFVLKFLFLYNLWWWWVAHRGPIPRMSPKCATRPSFVSCLPLKMQIRIKKYHTCFVFLLLLLLLNFVNCITIKQLMRNFTKILRLNCTKKV